MKLILMTDFVLEQRKKENTDNIRRFWNCERYANFLKQLLELWMFVPCDENGNVLEEPNNYKLWEKAFHPKPPTLALSSYMTYQQAKKRCLFEGFDLDKANIYLELFSIIESLSILSKKVELTQTAIKQLGL